MQRPCNVAPVVAASHVVATGSVNGLAPQQGVARVSSAAAGPWNHPGSVWTISQAMGPHVPWLLRLPGVASAQVGLVAEAFSV